MKWNFFSSATVLQMKCFSPWCSKSCISCSDAPCPCCAEGTSRTQPLKNVTKQSLLECVGEPLPDSSSGRWREGSVQDRHDTWQKILYSQAVAKGNFVRLFWLPNPTYVAPSVHVTTPPCCVSFSRHHRHVSQQLSHSFTASLLLVPPCKYVQLRHQFLVIFMDFLIIPQK